MIYKEILHLINKKLSPVIWSLVGIGILFFIMAAAVLFYPEILQILFAVAFFGISFLAFLIAIKINNIRENFKQVLSIFSVGKKTRKRK
jgi:hypothetical protein